ncbi:hypothetical protein, partial [Neisseria gonorrhoeae]|uniref:hypothetical protein n=1 Tax=Neisseria gonorrhoeae TaxID=485 RepID=UPI001B7FAD30
HTACAPVAFGPFPTKYPDLEMQLSAGMRGVGKRSDPRTGGLGFQPWVDSQMVRKHAANGDE